MNCCVKVGAVGMVVVFWLSAISCLTRFGCEKRIARPVNCVISGHRTRRMAFLPCMASIYMIKGHILFFVIGFFPFLSIIYPFDIVRAHERPRCIQVRAEFFWDRS
jgi:hypothetical protein